MSGEHVSETCGDRTPLRPLLEELEALYIRRYVLDKVIRQLEEYERCLGSGRTAKLVGIDELLPSRGDTPEPTA